MHQNVGVCSRIMAYICLNGEPVLGICCARPSKMFDCCACLPRSPSNRSIFRVFAKNGVCVCVCVYAVDTRAEYHYFCEIASLFEMRVYASAVARWQGFVQFSNNWQVWRRQPGDLGYLQVHKSGTKGAEHP